MSLAPMRVCTWNVNGLRALPGSFKSLLDDLQSDIICLQETKCSRDLDSQLACVDGYNSYFSHCLNRPGYSGVAIYCRDPIRPVWAADGFVQTITQSIHTGSEAVLTENVADLLCSETHISRAELKSLETEGRLVAVFLPNSCLQLVSSAHEQQQPEKPNRSVCILSVYVPRINGENTKRMEFRGLFERAFSWLVKFLSRSSHVVICGDLNVCHTAKDHCDSEDLSKTDTSLSLTARQWLNELLVTEQRDPSIPVCDQQTHGQFVDVFRHVHPTRPNAFTCWSTRTGARATNYGVRLDYILMDRAFMAHFHTVPQANQSDLMVEQTGSDHCPVWANLPVRASSQWDHPWPDLCSRFWPQCQQKQTKLVPFLGPGRMVDVNGNSDPMRLSSTQSEAREQVLQNRMKRSASTQNSIAETDHKRNGAPRFKQAKLIVAPAFVQPSRGTQFNDEPTHGSERAEAVATLEHRDTGNSATLLPICGEAKVKQAAKSVDAWRNILTGPKKPPLCRGHAEPCVLRTVKQECTASGARRGKRFWVCGRPQGTKDNPMARCDTFIWDDKYQDRKAN